MSGAQVRGNAVLISLAGALLIPAAQKHLGLTLTTSDVADLFALGMLGWHGIASTFERYFPPPNPTQARGAPGANP